MKNVVVFDGENIMRIDLDYFFQDPRIENLKPRQAVDLYQSTAVFANLLDDMEEIIKCGAVKAINEEYMDPRFVESAKRGLYILEGMMMDLFGDDSGQQIIEQTNNSINEQVTP